MTAGTASSPAGSYLDWGVLHISVTNLVIILVMVVVFVLAVLLPFPGSGGEQPNAPTGGEER
jgi:hypothetical protein